MYYGACYPLAIKSTMQLHSFHLYRTTTIVAIVLDSCLCPLAHEYVGSWSRFPANDIDWGAIIYVKHRRSFISLIESGAFDAAVWHAAYPSSPEKSIGSTRE